MRDLWPSCHFRYADMKQAFQGELTIADIRALAASIYEPEPRVWIEGRWCCPQCLTLNRKAVRQCACGITRDGLAEFCERAVTRNFSTSFLQSESGEKSLPNTDTP